jgi:hypothetical protein
MRVKYEPCKKSLKIPKGKSESACPNPASITLIFIFKTIALIRRQWCLSTIILEYNNKFWSGRPY